jgi:peptidoglycan hydrolase-like amidase
MIDSNSKVSKFLQSRSFWFIALFSLASCLPFLLIRLISSSSSNLTTNQANSQTFNAGDKLPILSANSNVDTTNPNFKKSESVSPAIVPKPPESIVVQKPVTSKKTATQPKAKTPTPTEQKVAQKTATKPQIKKTSTKSSQTPGAIAPQIEVSVAIETKVTTLTIGASTNAAVTDARGRVLHTINANQGLVAQIDGNGIQLDKWQLPTVIWIQPQQGGAVYIGEKWYRGKLLLVADGDNLLAINHVDLEHYLYSVVGSEMHPTANLNALKAQAVAARSYALVHIIRPASRWYNLGDTQRWQVYKGIETEYNTTQTAVNETNHKILSYQGGVVESLYAATDQIVTSVHGGRGMSQTGAYKLAEAGYDYQQILNYYYPGVELATLVQK